MALAALAGELIPCQPTWKLTNISNYYSRLFDVLFWLLQEVGMHLIDIHAFRSSHIHFNENKCILFREKTILEN